MPTSPIGKRRSQPRKRNIRIEINGLWVTGHEGETHEEAGVPHVHVYACPLIFTSRKVAITMGMNPKTAEAPVCYVVMNRPGSKINVLLYDLRDMEPIAGKAAWARREAFVANPTRMADAYKQRVYLVDEPAAYEEVVQVVRPFTGDYAPVKDLKKYGGAARNRRRK